MANVVGIKVVGAIVVRTVVVGVVVVGATVVGEEVVGVAVEVNSPVPCQAPCSVLSLTVYVAPWLLLPIVIKHQSLTSFQVLHLLTMTLNLE